MPRQPSGNRRQAQRFVGVRSGLTGETVIMSFDWTGAGSGDGTSALRLQLAAGWEVEEPVLGYCRNVSLNNYTVHVLVADGTRLALNNAFNTTDAAMDILQYLSDINDPRMNLDFYADEGRERGVAIGLA